ncbi:MAG TPA: MBOAT family O-acyltransferase [Bacteroidia bacterium]|nr:MBOAT family O-acyltransferase [Bacteroidia bacterium]
MLFPTPIFLFFFLPLTLALAYITRTSKYRNIVLVVLSLLFYIFGEADAVVLLLASVVMNYFIGKWVGKCKTTSAITVGITLNLLFLIVNKYLGFITVNLNVLLECIHVHPLKVVNLKLPVGISFYTFHSISYLMDVYRKENKAQKSFTELALYITLFPQLVAGPIIRYKDIASQFTNRVLTSQRFKKGIERFIIGLAKKVVIANTLGITTDRIMGFAPSMLSVATSWLAIIFYTLQLYFDFSGYSDMAIGLAKMLGFDFMENFNFPYVSRSIREFWKRWHISLSNWFRNYLYIPLGGNRVSNARVYLNLFIVFFLTGLWHGASWNFVIWGLIHGLFMVIERLGFDKILEKSGRLIPHIYTLGVVVIAWVFFRIDNLSDAVHFTKSLFGIGNTARYTIDFFINKENIIIMVLAMIMAVNGVNRLLRVIVLAWYHTNISAFIIKSTVRNIKSFFLCIIFIYSVLNVIYGTYNPFIYFRF